MDHPMSLARAICRADPERQSKTEHRVARYDSLRVSFKRDPEHWLFKYSPREWIRAAMGELHRAEQAYKAKDARAGLAGARRAAGMALNAALIAEPNERWGRTYIEHLLALKDDASVPEVVRDGSRLLMETQPPGHEIVVLRSKDKDERVLEAARDVMAHAYAIALRFEARAEEGANDEKH
jgi:HEPN domain-containing protein